MVTNFITSKYATSKLGKGKSKCKKNNLLTTYLKILLRVYLSLK